MNPIHWIRWKVLIALAVVSGGLLFFGVGPVAQSAINRVGAAGYGARWNVQDLRFNPVAGRLGLGCLSVDNPRQDSNANQTSTALRDSDADQPGHVLSAQSITFDLNMVELMRRRYCGQMHLQTPKVLLERRDDGSMNIQFGETNSEEQAEATDWWTAIQRCMKKMERANEQYHKMADKIPQEKIEQKAHEIAEQRKSPFRVDYSKRVTYPFQERPRFVATSLTADGLEIAFVDNTPDGQARGSIPPLKNGKILIENVSDNPALHHEPIRWTVTGDIAGAPIKLVGVLDERRVRGGESASSSHLQFDFHADGLPVEIAQFFAGSSLPLHFDRGTLTLAASGTVDGWNQLDVRPTFGFRDTIVSPQPGTRSIAGVNPDAFCRAFNEVSTLEINDLHVTGPVSHPNVELGHTLTDLVRSGGKAIARKQLEKGVQMGTEKIDKELRKLGAQGKVPPEVGTAVEDVKKKIGDRLKGMPFGEKPGGVRK